MSLYYACDLIIDFEKLDFDVTVDYLLLHQYELRIIPVIEPNRFITFGLKVQAERDIQKFIIDIGKKIYADEWYSISSEVFETGKLIVFDKESRNFRKLTFESLQRAIGDSNKFFRQALYSQTPQKIYRAIWKITREGIRNDVIGKTFKVEENKSQIKIAMSRIPSILLISFFVVMPQDYSLHDFMLQLPYEINILHWQEISLDKLPDRLIGNPSTWDGNIIVMWNESIWDTLHKEEENKYDDTNLA